MLKYKEQHDRKFSRHTALLIDIRFEASSINFQTDGIPMNLLEQVGAAFVNEGCCDGFDVQPDTLTLTDTDPYLCDPSYLTDFLSDVLDEENYDLIVKS